MKRNLIVLSALLAIGIILLAISLTMTLKRLSDHRDDETDTKQTSASDTVTDGALTESEAYPDTSESDTAESQKPDTTEPQKPDTTESQEPDITESQELDTTKPQEPDTTEPLKPDTTEPQEPDTTEPLKPDTTEPPKPDTTEPPKPDTTEPQKPDTTEPPKPDTTEPPKPDITEPPTSNDIQNEGALLEPTLEPAQITLLRPTAPGVLVSKNQEASIDYSNTKDGYVMVQYLQDTSVRIKVQVIGPTTTYTYNLTPKGWTAFPLSDGNGAYQIKVYRNVVDTRYATVLSLECSVSLDNEFAPFLRPNQYVNYENAVNTMNTAAQVVAGKSSLLDKVDAIYSYVVKNLTYDYYKAATVQSGYLPNLDQVLAEKKGICFDYAALMAGMLRSQNIACKLIVGYAGTEYHAWINVWSPDEGWIDGAIFFDGVKWQLMDPTFASTSGSSAITGIHYTTKYIY